jgi:sporulation protein YlmC with PRC-barrel domain
VERPRYHYLQSGSNNGVSIGSDSDAITLSNGSSFDLELVSFLVKYDSTVSNLEKQTFGIFAKNDQNLLSVGGMVLGAEGSPISLPFERITKIESKIIIPKSDLVKLKIFKPTINIAADKIFLRVEYRVF